MSTPRFQQRTRTLHSAKAGGWESLAKDEETDPHKISKRQKQIDFGYNTAGYQRYIASVPKSQRRETDPTTPNPKWKWSARGWSAAVASWRVLLHKFDPPPETGVVDITGSLKRITHARREGAPVPWAREAAKFKEELEKSAQAAQGRPAVHSAYKNAKPSMLALYDQQILCVPLEAPAAVSAVSAALRRSAKRPREEEAPPSAPAAPAPAPAPAPATAAAAVAAADEPAVTHNAKVPRVA